LASISSSNGQKKLEDILLSGHPPPFWGAIWLPFSPFEAQMSANLDDFGDFFLSPTSPA